jgi:anti-sigma B factor antagonist
MLIETSCRSVDNVLIVDCKGRIVCGEETAFLRHQVRDLINENPRIVLNLGEVSYIDSSGIGTLIELYTSAKGAGGEVKLGALTQRVKDVLQITKLVTVFESFPTPEEAVASFRAGANRVA